MTKIIWRTIVEIRNDYDKSVFGQWIGAVGQQAITWANVDRISLYGVTRPHGSIMTPSSDIELVQHWLK